MSSSLDEPVPPRSCLRPPQERDGGCGVKLTTPAWAEALAGATRPCSQALAHALESTRCAMGPNHLGSVLRLLCPGRSRYKPNERLVQRVGRKSRVDEASPF